MSIETALAVHAAAIRELAAALLAVNGAGTADQHLEAAASHVTKANEKLAGKPATKKPDSKPEPEVVEAPEPEVEKEAGGVTRDQVKDATLALGKAGRRDDLIELLETFGVVKSSALADDQLAAFHAAATKLLAE